MKFFLKIKLKSLVYFPCKDLETYYQIEDFLKTRKAKCQELQAINQFIEFDDTMQFITYYMNREFQIPLIQYSKLCNNQVIKPSKPVLINLSKIFKLYQKDLIENQLLQIQIIDLNQIWVQLDVNNNIHSIHIVNLTTKSNSQISQQSRDCICQEFDQQIQQLFTQTEPNQGTMNKIFQTVSKISFSKIVAPKLDELLIQNTFQVLNEKEPEMNYKDKIINNAVLNELFNTLSDYEEEFNQDEIYEEYGVINSIYQQNYREISGDLCKYYNAFKLQVQEQQGQKFVNLCERAIFQLDDNEEQQATNHRNYIITKFLQKLQAIEHLGRAERIQDIQSQLLNLFKNYLMMTLIGEFKITSQVDMITFLSNIKHEQQIQEIKVLFQAIYNELLIVTQVHLQGLNMDKKCIVFTEKEIETQMISISIHLITQEHLQPEQITFPKIKSIIEQSDFFSGRIKIFQDVLSILQDTLNTSTDDLVEKILFHLNACLEQEIIDAQLLFTELMTRILKQYLNQIVNQIND